MSLSSLNHFEIASIPERIRAVILSDLLACGNECGSGCINCVAPIDYGTVDPWDLSPTGVECKGLVVSWMGSEINGAKCADTFGAMLRILLFTPRLLDADCPDCFRSSTLHSISCERSLLGSVRSISAESLGFTAARFRIKYEAPIVRTRDSCSYVSIALELT